MFLSLLLFVSSGWGKPQLNSQQASATISAPPLVQQIWQSPQISGRISPFHITPSVSHFGVTFSQSLVLVNYHRARLPLLATWVLENSKYKSLFNEVTPTWIKLFAPIHDLTKVKNLLIAERLYQVFGSDFPPRAGQPKNPLFGELNNLDDMEETAFFKQHGIYGTELANQIKRLWAIVDRSDRYMNPASRLEFARQMVSSRNYPDTDPKNFEIADEVEGYYKIIIPKNYYLPEGLTEEEINAVVCSDMVARPERISVH